MKDNQVILIGSGSADVINAVIKANGLKKSDVVIITMEDLKTSGYTFTDPRPKMNVPVQVFQPVIQDFIPSIKNNDWNAGNPTNAHFSKKKKKRRH